MNTNEKKRVEYRCRCECCFVWDYQPRRWISLRGSKGYEICPRRPLVDRVGKRGRQQDFTEKSSERCS